MTECGDPEFHASTIVDAPSTTSGSTAEYTCAEGYTDIDGDVERTCQRDGTWSGDEPTCDPVGKMRISLFEQFPLSDATSK